MDNFLPDRSKQIRGFAAMDPEKRRLLAALGGRTQNKSRNPGNFANDPMRASIARRKHK